MIRLQITRLRANKNRIWSMIWALLIALSCMLPPGMIVKADETGTLSISGLELGDQVEVYRFATYDTESGSYSWEVAVSDWINTNSSGKVYRTLTPELLKEMTPERSLEFCETMISGIKNDSKVISNIKRSGLVVDQDEGAYRMDIGPGYYVIIPKGIERIYNVKWFIAGAGGSSFVSYEEGDYQIPNIIASLENKTKNRGMVNDSPFCILNDELTVTANMSLPNYPKAYATGKRIINATVVIPKGMEYVEDSIAMSLENNGTDYSVGEYKNSVLFQTRTGTKLFFGAGGGYFYEMDGSLLKASGTAEEALAAYNEAHGTGYKLPKERTLAISFYGQNADTEASSDSENSETTESTENTENTEATESIDEQDISSTETDIVENEDIDDGMSLELFNNVTVLVVAINTELELSDVTMSYDIKKNSTGNEAGIYNNQILLNYSVSPIDSNLICVKEAVTSASAYGIYLVLCEGTGESISMSPEKKLEESTRLTSACFYLYRLTHTYDGDQTAGTDSVPSTETVLDGAKPTDSGETGDDLTYGDPVVRVYDEKSNTTSEYEYIYKLYPDEYGETTIAGLEPQEYLLTQTLYPDGYTRSLESIVISKEDWTSETWMEGDNNLNIIWLDYKPVHLAGTGKIGIVPYAIAGTLISGIALLLLANRYLNLNIFKKFLK